MVNYNTDRHNVCTVREKDTERESMSDRKEKMLTQGRVDSKHSLCDSALISW